MERYHTKSVRSSHSRRAGYRLLHADSNRTFLAGNTGTIDDYAPFQKGGGAVGDPAAQWRNVLTNIKSDLEELGSSLDHLIKLTLFVKGSFPNGRVLSSLYFSSGRDG